MSPPHAAAAERAEITSRSGARLVADAFGPRDARSVILLHGGGQTRHAWKGTARAVAAEGFRALAFDLRGHGESDWPRDGDYRTEAFADDVREIVAALGGEPVLVGASLGGIASLLAIGTEPRCPHAGVVLVDIAPRIEMEGAARILSFMAAQPDGFASLDEAADAIASYQPHRPRPRDLKGLAKNLRRGADGRWRWHWDPRFVSGELRPGVSRSAGQMEEAARALTCPTLLVRGRESDLLSEDGARHFLELVPHARFVDVSGARHMVAGDRNDVFSDAVVSFLREIDPAG
jgi:pimeloyl-ACP methyl ester carboxylesterase